jgi:hypothetical protein
MSRPQRMGKEICYALLFAFTMIALFGVGQIVMYAIAKY